MINVLMNHNDQCFNESKWCFNHNDHALMNHNDHVLMIQEKIN